MTDPIAAPDVEKAAGEAALECLTTGKPFAECLRKRGYIAVSEPSLDVVEAARRAVGRAYYGYPDYDFMDDSGPMQRNDVVVREMDAAIAAAEARVREKITEHLEQEAPTADRDAIRDDWGMGYQEGFKAAIRAIRAGGGR